MLRRELSCCRFARIVKKGEEGCVLSSSLVMVVKGIFIILISAHNPVVKMNLFSLEIKI